MSNVIPFRAPVASRKPQTVPADSHAATSVEDLKAKIVAMTADLDADELAIFERALRRILEQINGRRFRRAMGSRLKAARVAAGYRTQCSLAEALKLRARRYQAWESGRTNIPHHLVLPICSLLGIDATDLFSGILVRPSR